VSFFEYVSVMVSVILALGVARILGGFGELLVKRDSARTYWVHTLCIVFYFLFHIRIWWAYWDLRDAPPTNLAVFMFMLVPPAIAYLGTYVLLPGGFPSDADKHFYDVRKVFYALGFVAVGTAMASPSILGYDMPVEFYLGNSLGAVFNLLGFVSANRRVQAFIVIVSLVAFVASLLPRFQAGAFTPS
jgi:hypothetical protein